MATSSSGKRPKKTPKRLADNGHVQESRKCRKWCTVLCLENNKEYLVSANDLETESQSFITEEELIRGASVVWKYTGTPYTAEVIEIHDEKPMPREMWKKKSRSKFVEDSSSSSEEEELPKKSKVQLPKKNDASKLSTKPKDGQTRPTTVPIRPFDSSSSEEDEDIMPDKKKPKVQESQVCKKATKDGKPKSCPTRAFKDCKIGEKWLSSRTEEKPFEDNSEDEDHGNSHQTHTAQPDEQRCTCFTKADRLLLKSVQKDLQELLAIFKGNKHCTKMGPAQTNTPHDEVSNHERKPLGVLQVEEQHSHCGEKLLSDKGVDLLTLRAPNPEKYALVLMDALFSDEEMGSSCYAATKRSKKEALAPEKIKLLEMCIDRKFGTRTVQNNETIIRRKCNQKCIDTANKRLKATTKTENEQ